METTTDLVDALRTMLLIRRFDESALELRLAGRAFGTLHPYVGQEAVAVGVCSVLRSDDGVVSNHRGHGHSIAKGTPVPRMMAELFGRSDGVCKGKGGSMHIADFGVGMLGANGIVGAGLPQAAGVALAYQMRGEDAVVVCFFGDGAAGEGVLYETFNIASLWQLPVVFVCENNGYASSNPSSVGLGESTVSDLAPAFRLPAVVVDGNDFFAVRAAAEAAVKRAREKRGPSLVECMTYRWLVHAQRGARVADPRAATEIEAARNEDPIERLRMRLVADSVLTDMGFQEMQQSVEAELEQAVAFAERSPFPSPDEALSDIFAGPRS